MSQLSCDKGRTREGAVGVAGIFATLVLPMAAIWSHAENRTNLCSPLTAGETVTVMTDPIRLGAFSFTSSRCGGFKHSERNVWWFQDEQGRNVKIPLSAADSLQIGDGVQILSVRSRDTTEASAAKKGI